MSDGELAKASGSDFDTKSYTLVPAPISILDQDIENSLNHYDVEQDYDENSISYGSKWNRFVPTDD
jgi:hypothetical protein